MSLLKRPELLLLIAAAFIAPIIGGHVPTEAQPGASIILGLAGDPSSVAATRLILGLLILSSLTISILKLRSVPLPRGRIGLFVAILFGSLAFAGVVSDFRAQSIEALMLWLISAAAMFATVAATGRRRGPTAVVAALVAAGAILGFRAVWDYSQILQIEPTYRAFSTWNNPNSVAGILAILGVLSIGLVINKEKLMQAVGAGGALLCGAGLALTQSKGGILALAIGAIAWAITHLIWKGKSKSLLAVVPLLAGFVLAFAWQTSAIRQASGAEGGRLISSGAEAEQSQGFRTLLWTSSVDLIKEKPFGWGPGTFRYESSRPGRQTATAYAHQTFLQTAYEGGVIALILLALIGIGWFKIVFQGAKALPAPQNDLRAAIVGAIVAFGANGMTESNLAFSGIALTVFILLGLGLQLSADGSSPELMPKSMRQLIVLGACIAPMLFLALFAAGEARKSAIVEFAQKSDPEGMQATSQVIESSMSYDGEALLMAGQYEVRDPERRGRLLEQASFKFPTPRAIRLYARYLGDKEQYPTAINVLKRVFPRDPNNLFAWKLMMELEDKAGNDSGAMEAARKLVAIEGTSYYQVNALGDLVSLETAEARIWLARREKDAKAKAELLDPAVRTYTAYLERTLPMIRRMSEGGETFAGQSTASAQASLGEASEAARMLADAYRATGDSEGAASASASAAKFGLALEDF